MTSLANEEEEIPRQGTPPCGPNGPRVGFRLTIRGNRHAVGVSDQSMLLARATWGACLTIPAALMLSMAWATTFLPWRTDIWSLRWWGPFEMGSIIAVIAVPALVHRWLRRRRDPAFEMHRSTAPGPHYRHPPLLVQTLRRGAEREGAALYIARLGVALVCAAPLVLATYDITTYASCKCGGDFWLKFRPPQQVVLLGLLLAAALTFHVPTKGRLHT